MRTTAPLERFRVVPEPLVLGRHPFHAHAFEELGVDVDALRAGHDLLPAHEEVVGVCEGGVVRGGVRVEGAEGARVLVDGVEVGFVLFEHDLAEGLLLCGAEARVSRMLPQSRRKRANRWTHGKVGDMAMGHLLYVGMRLPCLNPSFGQKRFRFRKCDANSLVARW